MLHTNTFADSHQNDDTQPSLVMIPVIEEQAVITKNNIETGAVQVAKQVEEKEEMVDVSLMSEEYAIEHVPINEYRDGQIPQARQEGDTLIIPVLREVLVKRVLLVEEIRIVKKTIERQEQQSVTLRNETVTVSRRQVES